MIRRRRLFLWGVILIYTPMMWVTLKISPTYRALGIAFAIWFVFVFVAAVRSAVVRCPNCGNYYHMHGMTLLYLRRCLHCQLHLKADRKS